MITTLVTLSILSSIAFQVSLFISFQTEKETEQMARKIITDALKFKKHQSSSISADFDKSATSCD